MKLNRLLIAILLLTTACNLPLGASPAPTSAPVTAAPAQASEVPSFGVPQVAFAHESQMDILAEKLGVSPLKIRLINALRPGSFTGTGTELKDSVGIVETLEAAVAGAKKTMELNW